MTLINPREALAEQSNFISYLMGLARLGQVVRGLAEGDRRTEPPSDADDFVHVLLGIASVGQAIDGLAESVPAQPNPQVASPRPDTRWLR
jgi:hypothetical protein